MLEERAACFAPSDSPAQRPADPGKEAAAAPDAADYANAACPAADGAAPHTTFTHHLAQHCAMADPLEDDDDPEAAMRAYMEKTQINKDKGGPRRTLVERASDNTQGGADAFKQSERCLLYTSPSPRDMRRSRMPSSA